MLSGAASPAQGGPIPEASMPLPGPPELSPRFVEPTQARLPDMAAAAVCELSGRDMAPGGIAEPGPFQVTQL
jgi:hypothetical protein